MAELPLNPTLMRPLQEDTIFLPNVGSIIIASNGDFDPSFNVKQCIGSLFDEQGRFIPTPVVQGNVHQVPDQELVIRQQPAHGDITALREIVRTHAGEVNIVRGLGIAVVRHLSAILPAPQLRNPEKTKIEPSIITIAEKIPGQNDKGLNFDFRRPENAARVAHITSTLQRYLTHDTERPHLADIAHPRQYSSDGTTLLDLDMLRTTIVGPDLDTFYKTCGSELRDMYEYFDLSGDQIADLQKNYSTSNRPRIEIKSQGNETEPGSIPSSSGGDSGTASLEQIYRQFEKIETLTQEAMQAFHEVGRLSREAAELLQETGDWAREQDVINATTTAWQSVHTGAGNLAEMLTVALERMWKSFPRA